MNDEACTAGGEQPAPPEPDFTAQYPGFTITCNRFGSRRVLLDNSLGHSAESGSWGSVDLVCQDCDNMVALVTH